MDQPRREKKRNPTVKDVAAAAGVSIATVSHVLNKTRFVSEETIARVENAIAALNYKANAVARHLRSGESRLIGYVVSNLDCYFYTDVAAGIDKALNAGDEGPGMPYQLVIMDSRDSKQREIRHIESLLRRGVDGIIIAPTTTDYRFLGGLLPEGFPVLFLDRQPSNYEADYLLLNNREASFEAATALIQKGYRRIAFITYHYGEGGIDATIRERIAGFEDAFRAADIPLDPALIRALPGTSYARSSPRQGASYQVMMEFLPKALDAVFCGNSFAAVGVISCLNDARIRIPGDLAFITYDNDLWMSLTTPRLSSIVQPAEEMGVLAAERLLERFRQRDLPRECFRFKANIVYRGSC
jgi:LacI family transcriptional regulator